MDKLNEEFHTAILWFQFGDACKEAATERDLVVEAPCEWGAPACVNAAAEARSSHKKQAV